MTPTLLECKPSESYTDHPDNCFY